MASHPITEGYTCPRPPPRSSDPLGGMAHYSAVPIEVEVVG